MKRADIKVGAVYVGKCDKRLRLCEESHKPGLLRCRCFKRYNNGVVRLDLAAPTTELHVSLAALALWANREATDEETAEVMRAVASAGGVR